MFVSPCLTLPCVVVSLSVIFVCVFLCKMERQGWQSRPRACSARTVSTVSQPFKKPRQAKERPSPQDTDSEGPTQLPPQPDNEGPPDLNPKTTANREYVPSPARLRTVSETDDEEDSVSISKTLRPESNFFPYI